MSDGGDARGAGSREEGVLGDGCVVYVFYKFCIFYTIIHDLIVSIIVSVEFVSGNAGEGQAVVT